MPLIKLRSSSIIESVHLGGTPTASNISSQIATTSYVQQEVGKLIDGAPELLDTLEKLSTSLGTDSNQA